MIHSTEAKAVATSMTTISYLHCPCAIVPTTVQTDKQINGRRTCRVRRYLQNLTLLILGIALIGYYAFIYLHVIQKEDQVFMTTWFYKWFIIPVFLVLHFVFLCIEPWADLLTGAMSPMMVVLIVMSSHSKIHMKHENNTSGNYIVSSSWNEILLTQRLVVRCGRCILCGLYCRRCILFHIPQSQSYAFFHVYRSLVGCFDQHGLYLSRFPSGHSHDASHGSTIA